MGLWTDYMHAVLLRVTRQITELLLQSSYQPHYIGRPDTLWVIENCIIKIQSSHLIIHIPRPLDEFRYWKASEWRAWLLFYYVPGLEGVLESLYLKHLSLLVSSWSHGFSFYRIYHLWGSQQSRCPASWICHKISVTLCRDSHDLQCTSSHSPCKVS